tara:strand:- start:28322 stop:28819 length:498 start_codon:yes stop_codon:yes gene_type:complete
MVPILAALWLSSGCKAELPEQLANDASGDFPCTTFADLLISYNPPGTEGGSALGASALGPPDNDSVQVLTDAVLSVGFVGLGSIINEVGADIRVHGSLAPGSEIAIYVADTDGEFEYHGALLPNQMDIDLTTGIATRTVSSIQLVGILGQGNIDAFEALLTGCSD